MHLLSWAQRVPTLSARESPKLPPFLRVRELVPPAHYELGKSAMRPYGAHPVHKQKVHPTPDFDNQ